VSELCDAELNALSALWICALIWLISPEFEPCADACDATCDNCAWSDAISEFNSSSSLEEELLEDDEPPPPPPPPDFFAPAAAVVVEVLEVEDDDDPLDAEFVDVDEFAVLLSAFEDALPFVPLVVADVCALVPAFEADVLPVPLP